jgi:hypothetical protein
LTGLTAGAGVGALWGIGVVVGVLPAIGPAIAGGTLAAILSSAAAGAAAAGVAGTLVGIGIPKDEAEYYEGEMRAGRIIVTVRANGQRSDAMSILRRFGGHDMESRAADAENEDARGDAVPAEDEPAAHIERTADAGGELSMDVKYYLYGVKKGKGDRHLVATFGSEQQLLAYVRWATLKDLGERRGKFEQGSALASYDAWEYSAEPTTGNTDDDTNSVVHNPSASML